MKTLFTQYSTIIGYHHILVSTAYHQVINPEKTITGQWFIAGAKI
jgi:hypothetical protein